MIESKSCTRCGASFNRNPHYSQKQWDLSQFCGRECSTRRFVAKNPMDGFFKNVEIDPVSRCWNWSGARDGKGYGFFRGQRSHRHMFAEAIADIPDGMWVLHRCDNRCCVNPAHLFLGTRQDNIDDMWMKGRGTDAQGEKSRFAKLTEREVIEIRSDTRTQEAISRDYGVAPSTVSAIKLRRNWSHV